MSRAFLRKEPSPSQGSDQSLLQGFRSILLAKDNEYLQNAFGCFFNVRVLFVGVLTTRAQLLGSILGSLNLEKT